MNNHGKGKQLRDAGACRVNSTALAFALLACSIDSRQVDVAESAPDGDSAVVQETGEAQPSAGENPSGATPAGTPNAGASSSAAGTPLGIAGAGSDLGAPAPTPASNAPRRLTVTRTGPASGRVTSSLPGIDCGDVCTAMFSGAVALRASTENGGDAFFTGWSGSAPGSSCNGPQHDCSVLMDRDQAVTANFAPRDHNLIFSSSQLYPPSLGGLAAYDGECNALASAEGINDAAGTGYIALMSDFGDEARPFGDILERIGSARGWVRLDGLPVADEAAALVGPAQYYPPKFTERGEAPGFGGGGLLTWTGLGIDANGNDHCVRWTEARPGSFATTGTSDALYWAGAAVTPCDGQLLPIYCIGITRQLPLQTIPVYTGKRIWLTNTLYAPGTSTPDQRCQAERPPGVAQGAAFIAYSDRSASAVIDPAATYVLSDGRLVGTGAQLLAGDLVVAPWLLANGTPVAPFESIWVGAAEARSTAGTLDTTCLDWTTDDGVLNGFAEATGYNTVGSFGNAWSCSNPGRLYCVEP